MPSPAHLEQRPAHFRRVTGTDPPHDEALSRVGTVKPLHLPPAVDPTRVDPVYNRRERTRTNRALRPASVLLRLRHAPTTRLRPSANYRCLRPVGRTSLLDGDRTAPTQPARPETENNPGAAVRQRRLARPSEGDLPRIGAVIHAGRNVQSAASGSAICQSGRTKY